MLEIIGNSVCNSNDIEIPILSQSACVELEKEEAKFHCMQDSAVALVNHTKNLLEAVRARHSSEMLISTAMGDIMHAPYVQAIKKATMESYCQALMTFVSIYITYNHNMSYLSCNL